MISIVMLLVAMLPGFAQVAVDALDRLPGVQRIEDVLIVDDVPYAGDHARQVMDVAMPTSHEGLLPVVVIIHGGGWVQGDKKDVRMFLPPTAGGGCLVVSPNYRLAPSDPAPAAIHDIKLLLRWLDRNAEELGIDRERIALMGFSSGGHLAALAGATTDTGALDPARPEGQPRKRMPVRCVVSIGGPMRLFGNTNPRIETILTAWIGPRDEQGPGRRALYSPVHWVNRGDPPILLIHGEQDQIVSPEHATVMRSTCEEEGVSCQLELIEDGSHMPNVDTYAVPLMRFLDEHLDSSIESHVTKGATSPD